MNFNFSVNEDLSKCFELAGKTGDWKLAEAKFRFHNAGTTLYVRKASANKRDEIIHMLKEKRTKREIITETKATRQYINKIIKEILEMKQIK